jgi:glycine/D-amino acid oxidase-like deaminating enzyme
VRARKVLLATHSYSGFLTPAPWPGLARTLVPVRSYQMATQPLPPALRDTVLPQGHSMSDTQGDLHFAHLDAQGRIVTGGALAFPPGYAARLRRRIGRRLLALYPSLKALGAIRFDHLWHGVFAATPDRLPRFWRLDDGVLGWVGCNGRGLALGTALGPLLADAALDGESARVPLPFEPPRTIPGHAFAPLGVAAAILNARRQDGRD